MPTAMAAAAEILMVVAILFSATVTLTSRRCTSSVKVPRRKPVLACLIVKIVEAAVSDSQLLLRTLRFGIRPSEATVSHRTDTGLHLMMNLSRRR